jgi:hypothetical protein
MQSRIKGILLGLIFLLPILFLLPTADQFHYVPGSNYSDIGITHYPNMLFIQKTIQEFKTIPLWNPYILSGYPFHADPLSGLWYPPGWIALAFPLPFGINVVIMLHILLGGIGFYKLIRQWGYSEYLAVLGAGSFLLLPKTYAHFAAGHITYLYAFTLTPWLILLGCRKRKKDWFWEIILIAGMILADVRWVPFGIAAWIFAMLQREPSSLPKVNNKVKSAIKKIGVVIAAVCMSAILLIPFIRYTSLSTRSLMKPGENLIYSLPYNKLLNIIFPSYGGSAEWMVYCGAGLFLLACVTLINLKSRRIWMSWTAWVLCILWSLGSNIPGLSILAGLPGINMLRVSPRAMFLGSILLIFLAIEGLNLIIQMANQQRKPIRLICMGIGLFSILITGITVKMFGLQAESFIHGTIVLLITWALIEMVEARRISLYGFVVLMIVITVGDLTYTDTRNITNQAVKTDVPVQTIDTLISSPGERIYSPSYSIPQDVGMEKGYFLSEGIDPLQLHSYVNYFQQATGVQAEEYSVVQPPLKTGDPAEDNRNVIPNARQLARLNVSTIVSAFPISTVNLKIISSEGNVWVYKNAAFSGYPIKTTMDGQTEEVNITQYSPNRIEYQTDGDAGMIHTSEIGYPGWKAFIDGKEVKIITEEQVFRAIPVEAGKHTIVMAYQPVELYAGLGISILTLVVLLLFYGLKHEHR